ncbi:Glycosyl transferase family 2 [Clavibacter michiganensis]|uniref:Glycosyl transferase family 2 n=1 Tax=Clavibacter michiganensis TaxID=28447 RepID=A0A251YY22_9MICO|nr:glycosyltransferase family A protein [Clavibacter michiganensis]OUE29079.1 Glycosyl transferase family 2 [Clavibacter michiganensis]
MDNDSTALPPSAHPDRGLAPPVSAVMVAGDAGSTIARSLASLLAQTVPPERVFVVVAGSRDDTFAVARTFNGRHARSEPGPGPSSTAVTVIDRGPREDSLRSAYDFALRLVGDDAHVLLVSPDAELDPRVLELLSAALDREPRATTASARLDPRPTGRPGPIAAGLRLLQRHWAMGAVETGTDLGLSGPVPLAPATLLRLPVRDAASSDPRPSADGIVTALLAGADRTTLVPGATARVDTAVSWATLRIRRDRWSASVGRLTRSTVGVDAGDRRRARLAALRIGVGPVLRVLSYGLAALYLAAAALYGTLQPAWWWALPLLVRLPLHIRTLRKIRERTVADVVFGATYVPLELGEAAYGVSRIRDGLRRLSPRAGRRPAPGSAATPWGMVDAVAAAVVVVLVAAVLGLAAAGGPAGGAITTVVGWAAVVLTAADTAMALLRLLVAHGGPFARADDAPLGGRSAR